MESTDSQNKECYYCTEEYNRFRLSVTNCSQCKLSLCSECSLNHHKIHDQEISEIKIIYDDLRNKINEKEKYINDTSHESIEIVINWYQKLINDLIETQSQIVNNIEYERDQARNELTKFDKNLQLINNELQELNDNINIKSIETKLNDLKIKLSNYQIIKDIYLPDSHIFQPRYKISYEFKNSSSIEEDWDIETNEVTNIPLPSSRLSLSSTHTTTPLFFSDTSQTFVTPKDEDEDEENNFQWHEQLETNVDNDSEYLLDPKLYRLSSSRYFTSNIHLIASNGNDILCYSHESKQLVFVRDGTINSVILQWYHGHVIQIVWFDNLQSFVIITDDKQYEIYTIESTYNLRLKIRLRTCLPKHNIDIIKEQIFLRTDEYHIFIYYERLDKSKRLRLLNPTFECIQSYSIDKCFQRDEHIRSHDNGFVLNLGVNQEYVVLFVRSAIDHNLADQAASQNEDIRLLVFNKSNMCFVRRIILLNRYFDLPFIVHFTNISSFFIIDQVCHVLRFFNYEKEIGQIKLLPLNTSPIFNNSTTMSKSNRDSQYSSIVLMNDGSLLISNNTRNVIQLVLNDQTNDIDDW
ncbi:unnamed protein product [Adineta steineri]|uniref:Uncharacterized protein n=2 Tax=Adineta steineri TaxID=433720 RepID=A0A818WTZ3_9BILA|nr:unnamed protein product [Adineta steineri]CAF3728555.1 unnamed protein product [Adineta steineri]